MVSALVFDAEPDSGVDMISQHLSSLIIIMVIFRRGVTVRVMDAQPQILEPLTILISESGI